MNDDLIAALNAERYGQNQWWTGKKPEPKPENEMVCRRRLAACIAEADELAAEQPGPYSKEAS